MVVRTDAAGNVLWQRVDQCRGSGDAALGQSGWEAVSSASEYVAKCADGGLIFINDEANGIGVMKLGGSGGGGGTGSGGGLGGGAIAGIAIGASALVVGLVTAVYCWISRRRARESPSKSAEMTSVPAPGATTNFA